MLTSSSRPSRRVPSGRRPKLPRSSTATPLITISLRVLSWTSAPIAIADIGVAVGVGVGLTVGLGVGLAGKPGVGLGVGLMLNPGPEPVFAVRRGETQPTMKTIKAEKRRSSVKYWQRTFPPTRQKYSSKQGRRPNETRMFHGVLRLRLNQTLASSFIWCMGAWDAGAEGRVVLSCDERTLQEPRKKGDCTHR